MTADVHSLVGAYVLDAVGDIERAAFDRHLRDCADCRVEVAELHEASARLADGAWSAPPPGLRDTVMAAIATTRQVSPQAPATRRPPFRVRRLLAAAAVVVAAAGAGSAVWAVQDHRVRDEQAAAQAARNSEDRLRALFAAPDLVVREGPVTGGGRVTAVYSRLRKAGAIILAADAAPAGSHVYQLWTIRAHRPVSEGAALAPGQATTVRLVDGLPGASDVGISVEPPGGSATPTMPLVADVKVT